MRHLSIILLGLWLSGGSGQNPALTPSTLTIPAAISHTNCAVSPGQTVYCFAGDGLWVSLNGAAYAQVQTASVVAGVTSIAVNGGLPQTGAVALTIPTKALSQTTATTTTSLQ